MKLKDLDLPKETFEILKFEELRPAQENAVKAGLLDGKSLLVCTPTASGKTLIAELAAIKTILQHKSKVIYIVPLVALAQEKYKEFKQKYGKIFKVALSVGDYDSSDPQLIDFDFITLQESFNCCFSFPYP